MWVLHGKTSNEFVFGSLWPAFKVFEVNTVHKLVNALICEWLTQHHLIWYLSCLWEGLGWVRIWVTLWSNWPSLTLFDICALYGKVSDEFVFGSPWPSFKVAEVNTVYKLVSAITCEIIDQASPNLVFGLFMGRSRMISYLGHLDLLSGSLRSIPCIDLLTFTLWTQ